MGAAYYRAEVALLTGWIHHTIYVLIVEVAIKRSWAHIFCLCAAMEVNDLCLDLVAILTHLAIQLPTFILALGSIYPNFRSNTLFALAFFTTRIVFHILLCVSYLLPNNRAYATGGSFLPAGLLACIFPLHAFWFSGCVKGFIKRNRMENRMEPTIVAVDIQCFPSSTPSTSPPPSPLSTSSPPRPSLQTRRSSIVPTLNLKSLRRKPRASVARADSEVDSAVHLFVR
jgi:hypothetical protein